MDYKQKYIKYKAKYLKAKEEHVERIKIPKDQVIDLKKSKTKFNI